MPNRGNVYVRKDANQSDWARRRFLEVMVDPENEELHKVFVLPLWQQVRPVFLDWINLRERAAAGEPVRDQFLPTALICFRADGSVRWSFAPGRSALRLADGRVISGTYTVSQVALLKHARRDGGRIVVASNHSWDWPQQVAILTAEGKLVDEYWHPGWFFSLDVGDLDDDGHDEILLGGVNNAYGAAENRGATLVVLDAESIRGRGGVPPNSRLRIADFPRSTEKRVLLFSEFAKHPNPNHYGHVARISIQADRSVQMILSQGFGASVFGEPYAHVQLDPKLSVTRVLPGASLMGMLATRHPNVTTAEQQANLYRKVVTDVIELPVR